VKKLLTVDSVLVAPPRPFVKLCAAVCWATVRPLCLAAALIAAAPAASSAAFLAELIAAAGFDMDAMAWAALCPDTFDPTVFATLDTFDPTVFAADDTFDPTVFAADDTFDPTVFAADDIFDPALFRRLSILLS